MPRLPSATIVRVIYLVAGENTYQAEQEVQLIARAANAPIRRVSGDALTVDELGDIMMGVSLFAVPEVTVIAHAADNATIWEKLGEWSERSDPSKTIIVLAAKPDKRTRAYKTLAAHAEVRACPLWTDRQQSLAREWLAKRAQQIGVLLSPAQVGDMVDRATRPTDTPGMSVIDQHQLHTALSSLRHLGEISDTVIAAIMPPSPAENIFNLLTHAVEKDVAAVQRMIAELRTIDDAHRTFALLAGQWFQLVAVSLTSADEAVDALGIKAYPARTMAGLARHMPRQQLHDLTRLCADIDAGMKLSQFEPWDGVERFALGVALRD